MCISCYILHVRFILHITHAFHVYILYICIHTYYIYVYTPTIYMYTHLVYLCIQTYYTYVYTPFISWCMSYFVQGAYHGATPGGGGALAELQQGLQFDVEQEQEQDAANIVDVSKIVETRLVRMGMTLPHASDSGHRRSSRPVSLTLALPTNARALTSTSLCPHRCCLRWCLRCLEVVWCTAVYSAWGWCILHVTDES